MAARLIQTLQFAYHTLSKYNYFGDVRIRISVSCNGGCVLTLPRKFDGKGATGDNLIEINREFSLNYMEKDFSKMAAYMMHELFNHFGFWKCHLFDNNGNYLDEEFNKL